MTTYLIISILLNITLLLLFLWYRMKWQLCTIFYQTAIHEKYSEIRSDGTYRLIFVKDEDVIYRQDVFSKNFIYDEENEQ